MLTPTVLTLSLSPGGPAWQGGGGEGGVSRTNRDIMSAGVFRVKMTAISDPYKVSPSPH